MPVRLRITLLFTALVFVILSLVCGIIYYVSYTGRVNNITMRLTNRAVTTARLLSQVEVFDPRLVQRIDAATTLSLKNKSVQAFDYKNNPVYTYSDNRGDTLNIPKKILDEARIKGSLYFVMAEKEVVAYHHADNNQRIVMVTAAYDEEGKRALARLRNVLLMALLGGVVMAFAGGYFFSKGLLLPIKKIADNVNDISAHNFTARIPTGTARDEWHYLSETINNLLDRLQESFELQGRFIANASHELSTPLTSISSQLEVSLQRHRTEAEYRQVMESIYQDATHMRKLTQVLLEFAKASGSAAGLDISLVRVDEILLRLPADLAKMNSQYVVSLQFDELPTNEEQLLVLGNEELLFTAIKNIVANACKYSGNHRADVRLAFGGSELIITVQDAGIGIPAEEIEHIFQPFYRVDESRHTATGFGLGLSLANRFIKLHKGHINISSQPGQGTLFTIYLPVAGSA